MKFHYLDVRDAMDMRMVYPKDTLVSPDDHIATNNTFYCEEDFPFGEVESEDGVRFVLAQGAQKNDCLVCDGKKLAVPGITCRRVHVAGIAAWGYFRERMELTFSEGSGELFLRYSDWVWPGQIVADLSFDVDAGDRIDLSRILTGPLPTNMEIYGGYIYWSSSDIWEPRRLTAIQLPDDPLMSVFAITLEV